jgi:hypothetical protein
MIGKTELNERDSQQESWPQYGCVPVEVLS